MTDVAQAPATPAAPQAVPDAPATPHYNSPFIPPLRTKPGQQAKAPVAPAEPAPEVQPTGTDVQPAAEAKPVEPPAPEKPVDPGIVEYDPDDTFDVVINGKKGEVTLGKLLASYQRAEAANEKFTQAKQAEQAAVQVVRDMTTPQGFVARCKQMQVDPYDLAAEIVLQGADWEKMTPEQKRHREEMDEIARFKRERQQTEQQTQEQRKQAEGEQYRVRVLGEMTTAMDGARIPANPGVRAEIISRAAGIMRTDREAGYETPAADAIREAWDDYRGRLEEHARALPVDQRVSQAERAQITQAQAQERVRVAQQAPRPQTPPRDESGKFTPARREKFDMYAPVRRK